jgi:hypothetical protein
MHKYSIEWKKRHAIFLAKDFFAPFAATISEWGKLTHMESGSFPLNIAQ